ncbi:DUF5312 family protein [Spirochaeta lutea]|uniref:Uncharacterized protein n=1 Tax=Spirochaeta lutea TaxID=1480694 RepID=A0A098R1D7_9SPIO|nr:DUF5312 family protein [Spirochaeta lutea]KGE73935.1 hypothetical protein DC28_01790 [Spirochaeta lutea]
MKRSTLDELSLALSPQERTALLEKIRKSLSVHNTDRQEIYHRIQEEGQKKDIVAQEIRKMGFWERFILWIRNIFSTKTQEEIASEILVRRSLRKLRSSSHPVLERDTEFLTTFFAEEVFTLYKKLIVPNEAVLFFWEKPENLRRAVEFVMAGKVPEAKSSLFRFIQFDQLVELYGIHESRTVLKEKILNEVSTYLQTIPNEVFSFIEEGILPLYFMKKLSQFPFTSFFSLFRVDLDDYQEQSVPDFKPVSLAQALEYIEHLAYALYSASKTRECGTVHSELLSFYLVTNTELLLQEEDVPGHPDEIASVPKEQLEALNRAFTQTADHIEGFLTRYRWRTCCGLGTMIPSIDL